MARALRASRGGFAFVLSVEQTTTGPHQAPDKKYYKRFELSSVAMEDYEIRDIMSRATTPQLYVRLTLPRGDSALIDFAHQSEMSKPVTLDAFIGNLSVEPAFHTVLRLGIDSSIAILSNGLFTPDGKPENPGMQNWLMRRISTPPELPIFKEAPETRSSVMLGFNSRLCGGDILHRFHVTVGVQSPGYTSTEHWGLHVHGQHLQLLGPGQPRAP